MADEFKPMPFVDLPPVVINLRNAREMSVEALKLAAIAIERRELKAEKLDVPRLRRYPGRRRKVSGWVRKEAARERKEEARRVKREAERLAEMAAKERWSWRGPHETKWERLSLDRRKKEIERTSRETAFLAKAAEYARELREALEERELAASEVAINAALGRLADEHEAEWRVGERRPAPAVYWAVGRVITDHDYIVTMFAFYSRGRYRLL